MGLIGQLANQLVTEIAGTLVESALRIPVLGDIVSMTGDVKQMQDGYYPIFLDGFSAPARYELRRNGIKVLWYNNQGTIWVSAADGDLAETLLARYK